MINIVEAPTAITLSRNPNVYRLRATDNDGVPYGAKGATAFVQTNSQGFSIDDVLTVDYSDPLGTLFSVDFTAKQVANAIGEITGKTNFTPGTNLEYFQLVAAQIQGHPEIAPYFTATASVDAGLYSITLEAKEKETGWTVEFDASQVSSGNNPTAGTADFVEDNTPDSYKVLFDVYVEQSFAQNDYALAAEVSSRPDSDGFVYFDISDVLHSQLTKAPGAEYLPVHNNNIPNLADTTRRYYVRYREDYAGIFGVIGNDGTWQVTAPTHVICGIHADAAYLSERTANASIITHLPNGRQVSRLMPEYVNWYNWTNDEKTVILQYELTDAQNETDTPNTVDRPGVQMITVPPKCVAVLPCGVQQLGISDLTAQYYRVRVIDHADSLDQIASDGVNDFYKITPYSEWRSFYIDDSYRREENFLVCLDGFCLPHTIRCVGETSQNLDIERQIAERIILNDTPDEVGESFQYEHIAQPVYTYRTGYISKAEALAMQVSLRYNQVWRVGAQRYLPLLLTRNTFPITSSRQFLHSLEITVVSNENPTSLTEEIPPLSPLLSCKFNIIGEYGDDAEAQAAGVTAGQHYYLSATNAGGLSRGLLVELSPAAAYRNDAEALAALPQGQRCYALAESNDYGMRAGLVKVLNGFFETYANDIAASDTPALSTNDTYPLARRNVYGVTEGVIKVIL